MFTRRCALAVFGAAALGLTARPTELAAVGARAKVIPDPSVEGGIYSWWIQPLAVNDGQYTWVSSLGPAKKIQLNRIDNTGISVQNWDLGLSFAADDHNAPAIAFWSVKDHLWVFWTGHGITPTVRYRSVSRSTGEMGDLRSLTFGKSVTYIQLIRFQSRLILVTRGGLNTWRYRVSPDFGETWETEDRILLNAPSEAQIYLSIRPMPNSDRAYHLAMYSHPSSKKYRCIDYGRINAATGAITAVDGSLAGNMFDPGGPKLKFGQLLAIATPSPGFTVRLLDVGTIAGCPAVSFAVWKDGPNAVSTYKIKVYRGGVWLNLSWTESSGGLFGLTTATQYVGGVALGSGDQFVSARLLANEGVWVAELWSVDPQTLSVFFVEELARSVDGQAIIRPYMLTKSGGNRIILQRLHQYNGYGSFDSDLEAYNLGG